MSLLITATGPTSLRTYVFPDANATILTTNAAVTAAQGGTGIASYSVGDLVYASGATALSKLAAVATGSYLRSAGVTTAPVWSTLVLPNTATQGDLMVATAANTVGSVADVATGSVLVSGGVGAVPAWSASPTLTSIAVGGVTPPANVEGYFATTSSADPRGLMTAQYSTDAVGARLHFRKGRGTEAAPTVIVTGDVLGRMRFSGYDGANYLQMASIDAVATGTIAATRVPTKLQFSTATDAAPSVLTVALTLEKDQSATFAAAGSVSSPTIRIVDSGLGLYQKTTNVLGFVSNGTLRMYLDSNLTLVNNLAWDSDGSGNVGQAGNFRPDLVYVKTALVVGTNPASTGAIRLANAQGVVWRNAANSGDLFGFSYDGSNIFSIGNSIGTTPTMLLNFGLVQWGGQSASFPALKRDTIFLQLRLADDSGVSGAVTASLPAGAAGRDGNIGFDTTLNAFVYYVGGNRYKLVGTSF